MGVSPIELALAVSAQPLSVDTLVEWGLARPSELLAWLDAARAHQVVAERESAGPGHLRLSDEARARALAGATAEDFGVLVRQPALVPELLGTARREASNRGARMAAELYRAVFASVPPAAFPGGPAGFVAAVVESVQLYRGMYVVLGDVLDRAITLATERGDLAAQARLLAARALSAVHGQHPEEGQALLARAREAGEAVGGTVRTDVLIYTAISLVFAGRLREGIAAFETLLGDVPEDLLAAEKRPLVDPEPDSSTPGAAQVILAMAYAQAGQHPRAVELLHQLLALGERLSRPKMIEEAKLFLGLVHALRGEHEAALEFVEAAFARFGAGDDEPGYGWFAGLALALVRASQGRLPEARAALDAGARAWQRAGSPPVGDGPYEIFEQLEAAGEAPPAAIDVIAEAERAVRMPLAHPAGLGHRFLAARLARAARSDEELAAAAARFETAIGLLREVGATYDLARACTEAAALAERRGRPDEARRWRGDAAKACPSPRSSSSLEAARLRSVVLDLGRLPLGGRGEGLWGEIAARLCEGLGAERCALVELAPAPRLLAARGGTRAWQEEILARVAQTASPAPQVTPLATGQLVLVPFAAPDLERRGFVALENVYAAPAVGARDGELLESLGVQLGVLLGNVTLWQELARARERLEQENRYFRESVPAATAGSQMVAHSPAMRGVLGLIARVAPSSTAVLITGETGVGKELVAHEIHHQSPRRNGPFIAVHIASLAPGLVASGLFGHERGAFTGATEQAKGRFELADGGTLLLDEVGELSLEDQVKLLRVLQEGTFERVGGARPLRSDFRLLAATNRDLTAEVRAGRFREDLYFRLCAFPLRVPPLRERREEIPTLALYFMERVARQLGVRFEGIGEADMERLCTWDWPGNVRELAHVIERAALLSEPPRLRIPPLEGGLTRPSPVAPKAVAPEGSWVTLAEAERRYIGRVLEHTSGRVTGAGGAAEILALKPSTLNFRIRKLGLTDLLDTVRSRRPPRHRAG
ncbi:MAG TPA: sigma 54-interacting transcriptional regulator [Polyangia bacterium]|jgi:transcriptional regulator with GAF, ATPase, and Fis domain/tetratricopeptide (TPR) repeat protein